MILTRQRLEPKIFAYSQHLTLQKLHTRKDRFFFAFLLPPSFLYCFFGPCTWYKRHSCVRWAISLQLDLHQAGNSTQVHFVLVPLINYMTTLLLIMILSASLLTYSPPCYHPQASPSQLLLKPVFNLRTIPTLANMLKGLLRTITSEGSFSMNLLYDSSNITPHLILHLSHFLFFFLFFLPSFEYSS